MQCFLVPRVDENRTAAWSVTTSRLHLVHLICCILFSLQLRKPLLQVLGKFVLRKVLVVDEVAIVRHDVALVPEGKDIRGLEHLDIGEQQLIPFQEVVQEHDISFHSLSYKSSCPRSHGRTVRQ